MNLFADSSALAKRYIADQQSEELDKLFERSTNLAVSVPCFAFPKSFRRCVDGGGNAF